MVVRGSMVIVIRGGVVVVQVGGRCPPWVLVFHSSAMGARLSFICLGRLSFIRLPWALIVHPSGVHHRPWVLVVHGWGVIIVHEGSSMGLCRL